MLAREILRVIMLSAEIWEDWFKKNWASLSTPWGRKAKEVSSSNLKEKQQRILRNHSENFICMPWSYGCSGQWEGHCWKNSANEGRLLGKRTSMVRACTKAGRILAKEGVMPIPRQLQRQGFTEVLTSESVLHIC